jgi:predicted aspartyl protease
MSSRRVLAVLTVGALTALSFVPAVSQTLSVAELLLNDDIERAESALERQPQTAENIALRGEIAFRKGLFEQAQKLYHEALQVDAKTARAHFGVGKLALAKVKRREALEAFSRAIALDPKVPLYRLYASEAFGMDKKYTEQRRQLEEYLRLNPGDPDRLIEAKAGLEMLKSFGDGPGTVVEAPRNPAPIRFHQSLNLIFASVMINGKGPYDFAIDTGATQTVVSEKVAVEAGLEHVTSTVVFGIGGTGKVETKLYKVKDLGIGDVKVKNVPVGTFNDPLITAVADGILGTSIFSDYIVGILYPANYLILSRQHETGSKGEVSPVWFFSNLLLLPLEVNGKRGNFIVDTGAVTTVLSHAMAAQLGVDENTPGARVNLGIAGVGGFEGIVLKVPNVTLKTSKNSETFPQVVAIDLKQISKIIGTEISGIVGYDFFSDYKLTLDYRASELHLSK